jgi:hypothetical protein
MYNDEVVKFYCPFPNKNNKEGCRECSSLLAIQKRCCCRNVGGIWKCSGWLDALCTKVHKKVRLRTFHYKVHWTTATDKWLIRGQVSTYVCHSTPGRYVWYNEVVKLLNPAMSEWQTNWYVTELPYKNMWGCNCYLSAFRERRSRHTCS